MKAKNLTVHRTTAGIVLAISLLACAGKQTETPAEVQQQAFDILRSEVESVITDRARAGQAIEIIDALESEFGELAEYLAKRSARYRSLHADYDIERAELDAFFGQVQADLARNQQQVSDLHRELVRVTTPQEWVQLSKSRNAVMDAAIGSIQQGSEG